LKGWIGSLISWGPLGVFFLAIIDSAGVPIPVGVDALLVILSAVSRESALLSAILAVVGSTLGCMVLFFIGRQGGRLYLDKKTATGKAHQFREWFQQYGLWTVFFPALLPVPLPTKICVLSAGALGVSPFRFALVILIARILRYAGLAYGGTVFGKTILDSLKTYSQPLGLIVVLLFLGILVVTWLKSRKVKP
jgi:membrane protein DedA with SNARE-associated domain